MFYSCKPKQGGKEMDYDLAQFYHTTINAGTEHSWKEKRERFFIPADHPMYRNVNTKWRPKQVISVRRTPRSWVLVRDFKHSYWHSKYQAVEAVILYRYVTINLGSYINHHARVEIASGPDKGKKVSLII